MPEEQSIQLNSSQKLIAAWPFDHYRKKRTLKSGVLLALSGPVTLIVMENKL